MSSTQSICTFHVGQLYLGVDVLQVQEVLRPQRMTAVPLAEATVRGLMNLRGQIVTAFNLRQRLGLPDHESEQPAMNVVIRTLDGPISLQVDEIGDVLELDQAQFEPTPETLQGTPRELIRGAYKLDGRLLMILDTERALSTAA
jgi:purine-binding chemotaxis protein CheW